jgi:hypothetical protein
VRGRPLGEIVRSPDRFTVVAKRSLKRDHRETATEVDSDQRTPCLPSSETVKLLVLPVCHMWIHMWHTGSNSHFTVSETPRSPTPKQAQAAASRLLACRIPKRQSKLKPLPQVVKTPCLPNSETAKLLVLRVGVLAARMPHVDPHVAYGQ